MANIGSGIELSGLEGNAGIIYDKDHRMGQVGIWLFNWNPDRSEGAPQTVWRASYHGEHAARAGSDAENGVVRVSFAADCSVQEGTQRLKALSDEKLGFGSTNRPVLPATARAFRNLSA